MAALPPLATPSALGEWVGQSLDQDPRARAVLSAASALVRSYTGQTWVTAEGTLDEVPDVVAAIVVQAAARVWVNPAGLTSITVDDATRRWGESGTAGLYLTAAEKDALADFSADGGAVGIGTLSVTRGTSGSETIYVPTAPAPSGPPFPWYSAEDFA